MRDGDQRRVRCNFGLFEDRHPHCPLDNLISHCRSADGLPKRRNNRGHVRQPRSGLVPVPQGVRNGCS
jgi:hypothetical protein